MRPVQDLLQPKDMDTMNKYYPAGITVGMLAAAVISWSTWHSVPWMIVHGMCSWLYVAFWAITHLS